MYPMMNTDLLSQSLKRRGLFAPPSGVGVNPDALDSGSPDVEGGEANSQEQPKSFADTYKELASLPPGEAQKKFRDFLESQAPNRENYKPGKVSKLGAVLASTGLGLNGRALEGRKLLKDVEDSGYEDAVFDYKLKGDKLAKAADLEEKDINNRVKTYRDFTQDKEHEGQLKRQNKLDDARITEIESRNKAREDAKGKWTSYKDSNDGRVYYTRINPDSGEVETKASDDPIFRTGDKKQQDKINLEKEKQIGRTELEKSREAARMAIERFKADHPNLVIKPTKGGNFQAINPKDGSAIDTGVDSGSLSDEDRLNLIEGNRQKDIAARGDQARKTKSTPAPNKIIPDTTKTTKIERDANGRVIGTTTITTSNGKKNVIYMKAPDGKIGPVSEENVDKASAAKYMKLTKEEEAKYKKDNGIQ